MELASLTWNSEMHCIVDIVEHHPTSSLIAHDIDVCNKGGLVIQHHDEIKFEVQDLAARALIPSVVHDEPQIYPGRSVDYEETGGMSTPTEARGDLVIRNIRKDQTDWILDVRITNRDAPSNIHRKPEAVLLSHEREKKELPPNLPGPMLTLLSVCGFM